MEIDKENINLFFKTIRKQFDKCLEPEMACTNSAIHAHSIQNSGAMDLLESNGHVVMFRPQFKPPNPPKIDFELVGRNKASTFTGLCNQHDTELFKPLDTRALSTKNEEQLFLLAYRAVTRELHTCMEGASRVQTTLNNLVDRGAVNPDIPGPAMLEATGQLIKAYETYRYRSTHYDPAILRTQYKTIKHNHFRIEGKPVIAVSSMFGMQEARRKDHLVRLSLNVVPIDINSTEVVISYPESDKLKITSALKPLLSSTGDEKKLRLSTLILSYVENFVIAPDHYDTWPDQKRQTILSGFSSTLSNSMWLPDDSNFMLF